MSQVKLIGVIGAGNMGSGIVQKIAQEGINVVMVDTKDEFIQRGLNNIKNLLEEGIKRKIFTKEQTDTTLSKIKTTTDINEVADADLVIEAIFEDKKVKTDLFKTLDKVCSPKTILATNTSSFYVKEFAEKISRPDRFIGLHYFFHAAKNRLLEVIPHDKTSNETIEKSFLAAKLHGKTSILVKDAPGFAVNRFFVPFLNEAARMLEEEVANIPTIEEAGKQAFKIGMGPFMLMNVTGIPIALHASTTLGNELGPFYASAEILKTQVPKKENWNLEGDIDESKLEEIKNRFYGVCLGVAAALVDEKVASIEDTDRGAKIGLRWMLGPFEIMNMIGIDKTYKVVEAVANKYPDFSMPEILKKQKQANAPFNFSFVDLTVKNQVAYITINRPETMNALNETVVTQLEQKFGEAENHDVKAIVIQGAGKAFVAGADIRYFIKKIKENKIDDIVAFTKKGHELFVKIENSEKLTIVLLDGLSLGGGSELALACQAIIATPAASMAFPETGIGIYPGLGGMLRFANFTSPELAKHYIFTGMQISANDAFEIGIITKLVQPAKVEIAIEEFIKKGKFEKYGKKELPEKFVEIANMYSNENINDILSGKTPENYKGTDEKFVSNILKLIGYKAPIALKIASELIDAQIGKTIKEGIELELGRLTEIFSTKDALEGLSSAGRKRPEFKGE
mmetsp:Transcript_6859/g.3819  ORF Transcript_6859/g.3819 Transcript_6859/m.3819 type:complete len:682 (+) Transcript_6859:4226-6271(+)